MLTVPINVSRDESSYDIRIADGCLSETGDWAANCLGRRSQRALIVSNPTVYKLYGTVVTNSLKSAGFSVSSFLMRDGESHKTLRTAESALGAFSSAALERSDVIVALGGGVVGDLAGFAASIYLRGIPFLQIPTTLLAMVDSSVGGKTGVNTSFGKNLTGAFHQPSGVLIDTGTLSTLPRREMTAGLCEVVKHAALSGKTLLRRTDGVLMAFSDKATADLGTELSALIGENVAFKASIVAADERESSGRTDAKSRKILNFGHTLAHALERVTDYRYFRHGEAVGHGIRFAAELSKNLALCAPDDVELLNGVVHRVGVLPSLAGIDPDEVLAAFRSDKKVIGGELQMILLKGIGRPVIISERDIPRPIFRKTLKKLFR